MKQVHWQKSSFSGGGDGDTCIELSDTGPHLHLRESDDPARELHPTPTALTHLLRTLKHRDH
ncbi:MULTISPECIES: DUF397 domain-containing protein [unclassified Streptomyces]|uniref:DUF397 domain-containing protein n=1 Tax=unclassified Streptomyces TaxID=2593676 RepID=UPI0033E8CF76